MKIYLKRQASFLKETIGVLTYGTTTVSTLENTIKLIPKGTYKLSLTWSPKFKCELPLVNSVPNRRGIRIHQGNTYRDTTGCILLGRRTAVRYLVNSRTEVNAFINWLRQHSHEIVYLVIV